MSTQVTKEQLGGVVRAVLATAAGYLKAKSVDMSALLDPVVIDSIATLLFGAVIWWSSRTKQRKHREQRTERKA